MSVTLSASSPAIRPCVIIGSLLLLPCCALPIARDSPLSLKRLVDLTAEETSDLWLTAQKIGNQLESYHKASSLTFAIQVYQNKKGH
ncbi:hypothetical protein AAHE18_09G019300 [Arachis hypogaea]